MNDEELRQAMAMLDVYRSQLESMGNQVQLLQMSLEEAGRAKDTLEAFQGSQEGDELLVPVGASSFVRAKVADASSAIVGVGNKLSVERNMDDAISFLDKNIGDIKEALKQATESTQELENRARSLSAAVQKAYQERQ